jgi:hypothetical protein
MSGDRVSGTAQLGRAIVLVTLFFAIGAILTGAQGINFSRYEKGTPTTATTDHCEQSGRNTDCYGTWTISGQSHTGSIIESGFGHSDVGTTLDVRVNDGIAYGSRHIVLFFALPLAAMAILAILFILFAFLLIRRAVRSGQ